jgi:hypothetical protein
VLAEGISEAMNCTAFAFVALLPVAIVVVVGWWRKRRAARTVSQPPASPEPYEAPVISEEVSRRYQTHGFDALAEAERVWIAGLTSALARPAGVS